MIPLPLLHAVLFLPDKTWIARRSNRTRTRVLHPKEKEGTPDMPIHAHHRLEAKHLKEDERGNTNVDRAFTRLSSLKKALESGVF